MIYFYLFFCETLKLAGIAHQDIVLYIQKTKKTKEQKGEKGFNALRIISVLFLISTRKSSFRVDLRSFFLLSFVN